MKYLILLCLLPLQVVASDCVILLHGLARTNSSMGKLAKALTKEGYHTVNQGYASRKHSIEELAYESITQALHQCPEHTNVNFVTHSMGGILVRQYMSQYDIPHLNHVVMLGPPNKGSEVVDTLGNVPGFKLINGPAGLQLGTGKLSIPNKLGPVNFSLGIIAGTRSINLILSAILPKPNDGKVSVENTKVEGMKEHLSLPVTHTFMMKNNTVIAQVLYFLKKGEFTPPK